MKKLALNLSVATFLLTCLFLTGCSSSNGASEDILNVSMEDRPNPWSSRPITYAIIQSKSPDNVTVNGVTVNRGNCNLLRFQPRVLGYGQSMEVPIQSCNTKDLLEVQIDTDKGTSQFSFN